MTGPSDSAHVGGGGCREASAELGSPAAEFAVSEIHIIHAEVKLMKLVATAWWLSANQFGV